MKWIDKIIVTIGHDKMIHLLLGALITAFFGLLGIPACLIGWVVTLILSVVKEYFDDQVDMRDVIYSMIGATIAVVACLVGKGILRIEW